MSTTNGAFDQKAFYDLEWIYYCGLPKNSYGKKYLPPTKFYRALSAQIKTKYMIDIQA